MDENILGTLREQAAIGLGKLIEVTGGD